ncbi:hypothetical protein MC885_008169, partial [Smutsia gigantea]
EIYKKKLCSGSFGGAFGHGVQGERSWESLELFHAGWSTYRSFLLFFAHVTSVSSVTVIPLVKLSSQALLLAIKTTVEFPRNLDTKGLDPKYFILKALYETCARRVLGQYQMTIRFLDNSAAFRLEASVYQISCPVMQKEIHENSGSTVCMKDFMSFTFNVFPCIADEEALTQGYNLLIDGQKMTIQVSFNATGVTQYKEGKNHLCKMPLKLTYISLEQKIILFAQNCLRKLKYVNFENKNIAVIQLHTVGLIQKQQMAWDYVSAKLFSKQNSMKNTYAVSSTCLHSS